MRKEVEGDANFSASFANSGATRMHGLHHVAQRSTTATEAADEEDDGDDEDEEDDEDDLLPPNALPNASAE